MEDLWKSRARSLQLRLRDRFRIAVDRHRRLPMFSTDGYFSSTLQRWLRRVRDFRRDSLPSSSAFYRKRGISLVLICFCWTVYFLGGMVMENDSAKVSVSLSFFIFTWSNGVQVYGENMELMESEFVVVQETNGLCQKVIRNCILMS